MYVDLPPLKVKTGSNIDMGITNNGIRTNEVNREDVGRARQRPFVREQFRAWP